MEKNNSIATLIACVLVASLLAMMLSVFGVRTVKGKKEDLQTQNLQATETTTDTGEKMQTSASSPSAFNEPYSQQLSAGYVTMSADEPMDAPTSPSTPQETTPTKPEPTRHSTAALCLDSFAASETDIRLNTQTAVTFCVTADGLVTDAPQVRKADGTLVATMNDSGNDGDIAANDGIYSGQAILSSAEITVETYAAYCDGAVSDAAEICFFRDLTQNDFAAFAKLQAKVAQMDFEQADSFLRTSDEIAALQFEDEQTQTIEYRTIYGITGVYQTLTEPNDSKGSGPYAIPASQGVDYTLAETSLRSAPVHAAVQNTDTVVLRPFRSTEFTYDDFQSCGHLVTAALNGSVSVIDDSNVTLDVLKQLDRYGTVLFDTHGAWTGKPLLLTGETLDAERFLLDLAYYIRHCEYSADYCSGRIVCGFRDNLVAVSSRFFNKYYQPDSLTGSFWFLGVCHSLRSDELARVLNGKGAETILGFDEEVSIGYCNEVLFETVVNSMLLSGATVEEGVAAAKQTYGAVDPNYQSECIIYGNEDFRLASIIEEDNCGTLCGKVCKASDRLTPVDSAMISVYSGDAQVASVSAETNGSYELRLPEGAYRLEISAPGYISFAASVAVVADGTVFTETFLMVEGDTRDRGTAVGKVVDAVTGKELENVGVVARPGWNNTTQGPELNATIYTGADGRYEIPLPLGNYTLCFHRTGYVDSSINVVVMSTATPDQNATMIPIVSDENNTYRIVLSWQENPRDLDSHLAGKLPNGRSFHVFFADPRAYYDDTEICNLDVDDTTSYGPETISLVADSGPYLYYVHKYAGSGSLASSGARVRVYRGLELLAEYNVPPFEGDYWNVFSIVDGQIRPINTMTDEADMSYIS